MGHKLIFSFSLNLNPGLKHPLFVGMEFSKMEEHARQAWLYLLPNRLGIKEKPPMEYYELFVSDLQLPRCTSFEHATRKALSTNYQFKRLVFRMAMESRVGEAIRDYSHTPTNWHLKRLWKACAIVDYVLALEEPEKMENCDGIDDIRCTLKIQSLEILHIADEMQIGHQFGHVFLTHH